MKCYFMQKDNIITYSEWAIRMQWIWDFNKNTDKLSELLMTNIITVGLNKADVVFEARFDDKLY